MKILYQGVDIYQDISVNKCHHEMYAGGHCDVLDLRLNDTRKLWDIWNPQKGDKISVAAGSATTGTMYIGRVQPESGLFTVRAYSAPLAMWEKRTKSWEQVQFLQLCEEVATRHGLAFTPFGVDDHTYEYVCQSGQSDAAFLQQRCQLEGAAFVVYDNTLVVYDEVHFEGQEPAKALNVGDGSDFEYTVNALGAFGSIEFSNGEYTGQYQHAAGRALVVPCTFALSGQDEADRFARNLLRKANKEMDTGTLRSLAAVDDVAAGSVVDLQTESAPSWNGPAFLFRLRNEYVNGTSKLFFRKPLEGY